MNPHVHEWSNRVEMDGQVIRECRTCDEMQVKAGVNFEVARPGMMSGPRVGYNKIGGLSTGRGRVAVGHDDTVGDHGGIVAYDRATETAATADGSTFTFEALARANRHVNALDLERALMRLPVKPKPDPGTLTAEQLDAISEMVRKTGVRMDDVAEAFRKIGEAMPSWAVASGGVSGNPEPIRKWTSDDALTLILEEIKHAPDPMKAAGEWITKVTNSITAIIRDLDDEHE